MKITVVIYSTCKLWFHGLHGNIYSPTLSVHSAVLEAVQFVEVEGSLGEVNLLDAYCEVCRHSTSCPISAICSTVM